MDTSGQLKQKTRTRGGMLLSETNYAPTATHYTTTAITTIVIINLTFCQAITTTAQNIIIVA